MLGSVVAVVPKEGLVLTKHAGLAFAHNDSGIPTGLAACSCLTAWCRPACYCCVRTQRDYLLGKMKEVEQKLSASKGVRQATERERKLASAANKLKVCLGGGCCGHDPLP